MSFTSEKLEEKKQCLQCYTKFDITDKDLDFYDKISPVFNDEKYTIPTPNLCSNCRQQRRFVWRNFFNFYINKCSATGKKIITIYSPDKGYRVYNQDFWWSDKWDALKYGKEYDFNNSFFDQFNELIKQVPKCSLMNNDCENCSFCNFGKYSKNCYLVAGNIKNEDCMYGHIVWNSISCIDCLYVYKSENCYNCVDCYESYNLLHSINCQNSRDCYGCDGLTNKQYCIFNKQYTKEEYFEKIHLMNQNSDKIENKLPSLFYHGQGVNNIIGDYIYDSSDISYSYDVKKSENIKYSSTVGGFSDCYDCDYSPGKTQLSYEGVFYLGYNILFSHNVIDSSYVYYSDNCFNSSHLFGCVGLKNKSYCILNKQYTKEEYNILVQKTIDQMKANREWGEFFPSRISPFGYNETVAQAYFPLEKQDAINNNFNWSDYEAPFVKVDKVIPASKLPENISDIPDDILNWAIECEITKKPFRIMPQELEFYRKHNLPVPRRHPDRRHLDRMKLRNPRKLFKRDCAKCGIEMDTTYAPDREETVYCEGCYNKEVY